MLREPVSALRGARPLRAGSELPRPAAAGQGLPATAGGWIHPGHLALLFREDFSKVGVYFCCFGV